MLNNFEKLTKNICYRLCTCIILIQTQNTRKEETMNVQFKNPDFNLGNYSQGKNQSQNSNMKQIQFGAMPISEVEKLIKGDKVQSDLTDCIYTIGRKFWGKYTLKGNFLSIRRVKSKYLAKYYTKTSRD